MNIENIFYLLGGIGLFILGINLLTKSLENFSGSKLTQLIEKYTKNKYNCVLIGAAITAIVQSSSAITVIIIGLVESGIMTLTQAVGIIMGANIGTTITGIIISIRLEIFAPLIVFIGIIIPYFIRNILVNRICKIISGFGILFWGMGIMGSAVKPLSSSPIFITTISSLKSPMFGLLIGIIFTAIVQSSSVSTGIIEALAMAGLVTLDEAIFFIYGQNIGTCVTALLASFGTKKIISKQVAAVHFLFNIIGTLIFVPITIMFPFTTLIKNIMVENAMTQIALVHVIFNIITTIILLPFSEYLIKLSYRLVPKHKKNINRGVNHEIIY